MSKPTTSFTTGERSVAFKKKMMQALVEALPAEVEILAPFFSGAHHVDVKRVEGRVTLDRFLVGMLAYAPGWLRWLYRIRARVVKVLGLREQPTGVNIDDLLPRQVSFEPGDEVMFFTIRKARAGCYWVAETPEDKHLAAYLAVLAKSSGTTDATVFYVVTIVRYKHWTGPVYFNLIRPFHHLVVSRMAKAGAATPDVE